MAVRRTELAVALLDDVERLRDRAWNRHDYYERDGAGPVKVTLDMPPREAPNNAYTFLGIAVDKHTPH